MCGYVIDDDGDERFLRKNDFIHSGTSYFTPAPARICHYEEVSFRDGNDLLDAGDLSLEEDRSHIRDLQEQMINAYVPTMIRKQCAGSAGAAINMGYRSLLLSCLFPLFPCFFVWRSMLIDSLGFLFWHIRSTESICAHRGPMIPPPLPPPPAEWCVTRMCPSS
jgi:hypothetical protein